MGKRARPEEKVIEPPSEIAEHNFEVRSEDKLELRLEGSREELTAIAAVGESTKRKELRYRHRWQLPRWKRRMGWTTNRSGHS